MTEKPDDNLSRELSALKVAYERLQQEHEKKVAELNNTIESLHESEAMFRLLLENATDSICFLDNDYRFTYMNPADEINRGFKPEEIIGQQVWQHFKPEGLAHVQEVNAQRLEMEKQGIKTGEIRYEIEMACKDGSWMWADINVVPLRNQKGEMVGYHAIARNITNRKQNEAKLIESERSKSVLLKNIPGMAYRCKYDRQWTMEFVSEGCFNLTGYNPDDLLHNKVISFNDIIAPEYKETIWGIWETAIKEGKPAQLEYEIICEDGRRKWVWEQGVPIFSASVEIEALEGLIIDISDRKETEKTLRIFMESVDNSSDAIGMSTPEGKHYYQNKAFCQLFGHLVGSHPPDSLYVNKQTGQEVFDAIMSGNQWTGEVQMYSANKEILDILLRAYAAKDNAGNISALVGVHTDITEKKQSEKELLAAKERAEESDRLKSAFLANMSHEIRTPMNGILGFAELLKESGLSKEKQEHYVQIIENSGHRMMAILNDIIDISRIEAGLMEIDLKDVDITEVFSQTYAFFKPEADAKQIELVLENAATLDKLVVRTDGDKFYAILTNLVKNAVKYTRQGRVSFGYSVTNNHIEFFVKDTGAGIPEQKQEAIFERFLQSDIDDIKAIQGAGLGLSISKAYVEMLGGSIWVESELNKGSVFRFTLPV